MYHTYKQICNIVKLYNKNILLHIIIISAIKRCKCNYSQLMPTQRKRWAHEVLIMKRLKHPNIVRTGCVPFKLPNVEENEPILCMEYCRKGDLRKVVFCLKSDLYKVY